MIDETCERMVHEEADWWRKATLFWMAVELGYAKAGDTIHHPAVAALHEAFGGTPSMMVPSFCLALAKARAGIDALNDIPAPPGAGND